MDEFFTKSHVKKSLNAMDFIQRVNVSDKGDVHLFEAHVDEHDEGDQAEIEKVFEQYDPNVSAEITANDEPYYEVKISGLFDS